MKTTVTKRMITQSYVIFADRRVFLKKFCKSGLVNLDEMLKWFCVNVM